MPEKNEIITERYTEEVIEDVPLFVNAPEPPYEPDPDHDPGGPGPTVPPADPPPEGPVGEP